MEIDVEQRELQHDELKRAFSEMQDSPMESRQHLTLNADGTYLLIQSYNEK